MIKKILILFFLSVSLSTYAQANKQDVKTLLELSGKFSVYQDVVDQFVNQLSESKREAFKKDVNVFIERISKNDINRYASAFSQDEVLKLIEFYKSPLGKKMVEKGNEFSKASSEEAQENYIELQGIIMKYMM